MYPPPEFRGFTNSHMHHHLYSEGSNRSRGSANHGPHPRQVLPPRHWEEKDTSSEIRKQAVIRNVKQGFEQVIRALETMIPYFKDKNENVYQFLIHKIIFENLRHENLFAQEPETNAVKITDTAFLTGIKSMFNSNPRCAFIVQSHLTELRDEYLNGRDFLGYLQYGGSHHARFPLIIIQHHDDKDEKVVYNIREVRPPSRQRLVEMSRFLAHVPPHALMAQPLPGKLADIFGSWMDIGLTVHHRLYRQQPVVLTDSPGRLKNSVLAGFTQSSTAKNLMTHALADLDTACNIIGDGIHYGLRGISMSCDHIDFGVQKIAHGDDSFGSNLLDALGALPGNESRNGLEFQHFKIENNDVGANENKIWILGGVAAPQFPLTFSTIDPARIFWKEGHLAVGIGPNQSHTITQIMSRLRRKSNQDQTETGMLQQVLLMFLALPSSCSAYHQIPHVKNVAFVDVYDHHPEVGAYDTRSWPFDKNEPIAVYGSKTIEHLMPNYRIIVCARKVYVSLLTESQRTAQTHTLNIEAKPFIPPHLRAVFDSHPSIHLPEMALNSHDPRALQTLMCNERSFIPFEHKYANTCYASNNAQHHESTGETGHRSRKLQQEVLRFHRLLDLEEEAMEESMRRFDLFNARLQFAVFDHMNPRQFTEYRSLWPSGRDASPRKKQLYRGPALDAIIPEPNYHRISNMNARDISTARALAILRVPGLREGRPALIIGDVVYLRNANNLGVEVTALIASVDGDTLFLVLPPVFWDRQNCSTASFTTVETVEHILSNGLVHVRFSFDRRPFEHMHAALEMYERAEKSPYHIHPLIPLIDSNTMDMKKTIDLLENIDCNFQPTLDQVEKVVKQIDNGATINSASTNHHRSFHRLNLEQRKAVATILCGGGRASPFALHGPPGTGKTVTMVALVLEILRRYSSSGEIRVLCCAPQNYSADLIVSHLAAAGVTTGQMLRLNDPRRPVFSAKEDIMQYTSLNQQTGMFSLLPREVIRKYEVVVCTCATAAYLATKNNDDDDDAMFSHVFIDEGGQALLPEALIPLILMKPKSTISSLYSSLAWGTAIFGDPHQLGPVVHSQAASFAGLGTSLLERLINAHSPFTTELNRARKGMHGPVGLAPLTMMLTSNYRSHRDLLELPSKMFYKGELMAAADPGSVAPPIWSMGADYGGNTDGNSKNNKDHSISNRNDDNVVFSMASMLFYGVHGRQEREGDAVSYHNPLEASAVVDLVQGLLSSSNGHVSPQDIGVMATYRRQVQSIRILLRHYGLGEVRVGTVDDYQGQEERIIFISTVLTKPASMGDFGGSGDGKMMSKDNNMNNSNNISLWNSPKRFNVAITRAKSLLVVVGHPTVLIQDRMWRELLRHCAKSGAYRGAGASAVATLLGHDHQASKELDVGFGVGQTHHTHYDNVADDENVNDEMSRAIEQMVELALLGSGQYARMFPETLDEMYQSYADELEWRIML